MNSKKKDNYILGGVKIKDGVFIGDQFIFNDDEFITNNKIKYIINTTSYLNKNNFLNYSKFFYLKLNFKDKSFYKLTSNTFLNFIKFMDESKLKGWSTWIFSVNGNNKVCTLIIIYLMYNYNWTINKAWEFIKNKINNLKIKPKFLEILKNFEKDLSKEKKLSNNWEEIFTTDSELKNEELLLINTYKNSNMKQKFKFLKANKDEIKNPKKIKWNLKNKRTKKNPKNKEFKSILKTIDEEKIKYNLFVDNINKKNELIKLKLEKIEDIDNYNNNLKESKSAKNFDNSKENIKSKDLINSISIKNLKEKKQLDQCLRNNSQNDNFLSLYIKNNFESIKNKLNVSIKKENNIKKKTNYNSKISTYLSEDSNNKNLQLTKNKNFNLSKKNKIDNSLNKSKDKKNIDIKDIYSKNNKYLNFSFNENFNIQKNKVFINSINKHKSKLIEKNNFIEKTKKKLNLNKINLDNFKEISNFPFKYKNKTIKNKLLFTKLSSKRPNSCPLKEENEIKNNNQYNNCLIIS